MLVKGIEFERKIADAEHFLSMGAAIPILGSLAGAVKVILGAIQTVGALLALVISSPFLFTANGRQFAARAGSHLINGFANILAGALEAIPFLGSGIFALRTLRSSESPKTTEKVHTGQENMLIVGYRVLEKEPYVNYLTARVEEPDLSKLPRISPLLVV